MARTVRDEALQTRSSRARLAISSKPYFRMIDQGLHLGYRKGRSGGRWVMRWYVGREKYRVETIGLADDILDADGHTILNFSHAQTITRTLFISRTRERDGVPEEPAGPYTVKTCLEEYIDWLEINRKTAGSARYRANGILIPALGELECAKLTTIKLETFIKELVSTPARSRTRKGQKQKYRNAPLVGDVLRRRQASVNRTMGILKAALNRAWSQGIIPSDTAWRRIRPFKGVSMARVRYLTVNEAKRLVKVCPNDFKRLVQAGLLTGARYGELWTLNVEDFIRDSGTIRVCTSKSGKARHIVLSDEGIAFFKAITKNSDPLEPMFIKDNGERWGTSHQIRVMRETCAAAELKPKASFHCLRHTYASHAIMNGAPLMVIAKNLGHADTRMVEKHYGHLAPSFIAEAIRAAAPRFGFHAPSKLAA